MEQKDEKRNPEQAAWIIFLLSRKRISQTELAQELGVCFQAVNLNIWGLSSSRRIKQHIADRLGYKDWDRLIEAGDSFHRLAG